MVLLLLLLLTCDMLSNGKSIIDYVTHWPLGKNSLTGTLGGSVCFTGPAAAAANMQHVE
jgi:hypothetical protein